MNIGPTELVFVMLILVGPVALGIGIWAIVDAANRPQAAWDAIGSSKGTWITLIAVFTFFCTIVGLILAIVYLASVRGRLTAAGG